MRLHRLLLAGAALAAGTISIASACPLQNEEDKLAPMALDSISRQDSAPIEPSAQLTEQDYRQAAKELDIEVAAIKAVALIEAGHKLQGFHAPRVPIINFDLTMFTKSATRRGTKLNKFKKTHPVVFARPDKKRYGSFQEAQHARLASAMTIDSIAAIEGTFWGMFQIGGFNWKKCGADSHSDFVDRMSQSESEQLKLFVNFIRNNNLEKYLRKKDWEGFARIYNGPSYKKRNYHKRMAVAYRKFAKESILQDGDSNKTSE